MAAIMGAVRLTGRVHAHGAMRLGMRVPFVEALRG